MSSESRARAIGIAPLKIIDGEHQGASVAQPRQQFAQGDEGPSSQLSRVGDLDRTPRQRRTASIRFSTGKTCVSGQTSRGSIACTVAVDNRLRCRPRESTKLSRAL